MENKARSNIQLKKEWLYKVSRLSDSSKYNINIFMMLTADNDTFTLTLNADLIIDGEIADNECVMFEEYAEEPSEPSMTMKRKLRTITKFFSEHFYNVNVNRKIIIV